MSGDLDLVRSIYAAREAGDFSSADWAHPAIEYVVVDGPFPAMFTGLSEMARGRGKTSGLELGELSTHGADVVEVRDGKVTRIVKYYDRDRALADLGLAANPTPQTPRDTG